METSRLMIRTLEDGDEQPFISGIRDRSLRTAYGFPPDMDDGVSAKIFSHFRGLENAFALAGRASGEMIGFLLDVDPELPGELTAGLPQSGRTLAFAVFPSLQRQGYMREALHCYISRLFWETETAYIHCGHFTDNEASRNLLRGLGFREYGRHEAGGRVIVDEILFRPVPDTGKN